jgi:uncharacterized protein (TIGR03118 family)
MSTKVRSRVAAILAVAALSIGAAVTSATDGYETILLVSNVSSTAKYVDPDLLNPWGLVLGPRGSIWVAENHSGMLASFGRSGVPAPGGVAVPGPGGTGSGSPTGLIYNDSDGFQISNGRTTLPSRLLTATEDGTIIGFNPMLDPSQGFVAVDRSGAGIVYKGLALARGTVGRDLAPEGQRDRLLLYAADFHGGQVEVFDSSFALVSQFTDPLIPEGYAPFNVVNIGNRLFVTFAKQKLPDKMDDDPGPGHGYLVVFDTSGNVLRRFASAGPLNSPWGLALAPRRFGFASRALLVGNFGDGVINAFDYQTGHFLGTLTDSGGAPIVIEGLWALAFDRQAQLFGFGLAGGSDATAGSPDGASVPPADQQGATTAGDEADRGGVSLYFTAGPNGEQDGILGLLRPASH